MSDDSLVESTEVAEVQKPKGRKPKGAKKAAPAKAKAKKPKAEHKPRERDLSKLDGFGFRKDSLKSQAAAMYAKGKGATLSEVQDALDSTQYNLLNELKEKGFTITRTSEKGAGNREVTRFKISKAA